MVAQDIEAMREPPLALERAGVVAATDPHEEGRA